MDLGESVWSRRRPILCFLCCSRALWEGLFNLVSCDCLIGYPCVHVRTKRVLATCNAWEAKKKQKVQCSRCSRKGHLVTECPLPLYCIIYDTKTHVSHKCPLLKAEKPVALAVGYGAPGLGFHYIPVSDKDYLKPKIEAAWSLVNIKGGEMTVPQVVAELERLVPVPWTWEVKEHGINSFLAAFPNAMELARMEEFGELNVKNRPGVKLECKIWGTNEEVKFQLPVVWVQVGGIPEQLRNNYLVLWAVGTLLGATQMVDMVFTRSNDLARIKIAVLDPKKIPQALEVVFGKYLHGIFFIVEEGESSSTSKTDDKDTKDPMDEDDDLLGEEEKEMQERENRTTGSTEASTVNKNPKTGSSGQQHGTHQQQVTALAPQEATFELLPGDGTTTDGGQCEEEPREDNLIPFDGGEQLVKDHGSGSLDGAKPQEDCRPLAPVLNSPISDAFIKEMAEKIVDRAVGIHLERIADQVLNEEDEHPSMEAKVGSLTPSKRTKPQTPVRWSKRREGTVDENSLERAQRLTAIRNLDAPPLNGCLQGYLLDSVLDIATEGKQSTDDEVGLPYAGVDGYGDLRKTRVDVY